MKALIGTLVVGLSLLASFLLQPSNFALVPMLLGIVGLAVSTLGTIEERRCLERQLKQERQDRQYHEYRHSEQGQLDIVFDRLRRYPGGSNE